MEIINTERVARHELLITVKTEDGEIFTGVLESE